MTHFEKSQKATYSFLSTGKQEKIKKNRGHWKYPKIYQQKKNWEDSLTHQLVRANFIPIFDVSFFCPRFWVISYWSAACQAFKSCLLIGCQKQLKQLPKIVDQTWVTHFNLFKHLNDLQLFQKLFESIYLVPSTS